MIFAYVTWERYIKYEYNNTLASNENGHYVGNKEKMLRKE